MVSNVRDGIWERCRIYPNSANGACLAWAARDSNPEFKGKSQEWYSISPTTRIAYVRQESNLHALYGPQILNLGTGDRNPHGAQQYAGEV